jgi:hypothetical protein
MPHENIVNLEHGNPSAELTARNLGEDYIEILWVASWPAFKFLREIFQTTNDTDAREMLAVARVENK